MKMQFKKYVVLLGLAVLLVFLSACGQTTVTGETVTETKAIEQGDATAVEADILFGLGKHQFNMAMLRYINKKYNLNVKVVS